MVSPTSLFSNTAPAKHTHTQIHTQLRQSVQGETDDWMQQRVRNIFTIRVSIAASGQTLVMSHRTERKMRKRRRVVDTYRD